MVVVRTIAILRNHSLVNELQIVKTLVDPMIELIKANATIKDGSILFVNEAIGENWREYSYHWQKDGKMIRRWDNAPHHKETYEEVIWDAIEDFQELSEETKRDMEEARDEIKVGKIFL